MVSLAALSTLGPALYSIIIIALGINGGAHDEKWLKVNTPPTLAEGGGEECWIDRGDVNSERTCCPSAAGRSPCNPLGEWLAGVLESNVGAFFLPLVPWLLHVNVGVVRLREHRHELRRLGLHVAILLFRLLVLWLLFDGIENAVVRPEPTHAVLTADGQGGTATNYTAIQITDEPPAPAADRSLSCATWAEAEECKTNAAYMQLNCATSCSACWYGYMRTDFQCSEQFDFSDHLVLYMVAYFATAGVETYAYIATGRDLCPVFVPLATVFTIVLTICMYRSAAFFHTPGEAITSWVIALLFVQLPLFLALSGDGGSQLHCWIVEPPPAGSKREATAIANTKRPEEGTPEPGV